MQFAKKMIHCDVHTISNMAINISISSSNSSVIIAGIANSSNIYVRKLFSLYTV